MSGTGAAIAPRMVAATLRTAGQASPGSQPASSFCPTNGCEPAVAAERAAAIDHVRAKIALLQRTMGKGRIVTLGGKEQILSETADWMIRCLDELAEDFSRGLHVKENP